MSFTDQDSNLEEIEDFLKNISDESIMLSEITPVAPLTSTSNRFPTLSADDRIKIIENSIPVNTRKKEKWAIKIFTEWHEKRKEEILNNNREGLLVLKDISEWTSSDWNLLLEEFILEVRKENGEKYTPSSLKDIFSMLQHYTQYTLRNSINFWQDTDLKNSRMALDAAMKDSVKCGFVSGKIFTFKIL